MHKPDIERRKHQRSTAALPLKICKSDADDVITETRNISCSGIYCRVNKPVPVMSKVGLTLLLPLFSGKKVQTKKIQCQGVVVRSEPEIVEGQDLACENIAIFFTDLSGRDKDKVEQYVGRSCPK